MPAVHRSTLALTKKSGAVHCPGAASFSVLVVGLFLFFFVEVVVIEIVIFVVEVFGLVFVLVGVFFAGIDHGSAFLVELHVDAHVTELCVHELEELVDVVAAPLVEHVGEELEEVAAVEAALDLFDLFLRERFENVFAQRFDVPLLHRVLRGEANLTNSSFVEYDLHRGLQGTRIRESAFPCQYAAALAAGCILLTTGMRTFKGVMNTCRVCSALAILIAGAPRAARADVPPPAPDASPSASANADEAEVAAQGNPGEASRPPPLNVPYLQYGAGITAESVLSAGAICSSAVDPCILGSGGGVLVRLGLRSAGPWYVGGAYELSKQDPGKLYRLGILQQLRFEGRYYIETGRDVQPVVIAGGGVAGYGNEWSIDTWGPMLYAGAGAEAQITRTTVVGVYVAYRAMYLKGFTDPSHADRSGGLAQLVSLEFDLGARDPFGERRIQ